MFGLGKRRPSAKDAAVRAYVLKSVVISALALPPQEVLDEQSSAWSQSERDDFFETLAADRRGRWAGLGRWKARLSPNERLFASALPQDVTPRQHTDAIWRLEAFQVLLWALGLLENLPGYDTEANEELLKGFPPGEFGAYIRQARLRPAAEIDEQRDMAELWHWRSRTRWLIETETPIDGALGFESYDKIVRSVAAAARDTGDIGVVTDEDFTAFGLAYRDLSDEQWSTVRSITAERHFALNWLCGYAPGHRWDDTPTDT